MGPHILSSALLLALLGQAHAQPALDDATPCSVAVSAFSSADKERMQAVANFIENAFEQLDRRYTENGEAGIANECPGRCRGWILPPTSKLDHLHRGD